MSVKIRLARRGSKKRPYYKIIVASSRSPRDGKFIDDLGFYNPLKEKDSAERFAINKEKATSWIEKGAIPSDTVAKLFLLNGINIPETVKKSLERQKALAPKPSKKELKKGA